MACLLTETRMLFYPSHMGGEEVMVKRDIFLFASFFHHIALLAKKREVI
jgi:hypothetical protein